MASTLHTFMILLSLYLVNSIPENQFDEESLHEQIEQHRRAVLKQISDVRNGINKNIFEPETFRTAPPSGPIADDDDFNEKVSHNIRDNILTFIDNLKETVKRDDNVHKPVKVKISSSNEQLTDNETSSANRTTTDDVLTYINTLQDAIVTEENIRKSFRDIPSSGHGTDDTFLYQHIRKIYNLLGDMFEDDDKVQLFRDMLLNLTENSQPEETT